jgi:hypothetical protein
MIELIEWSFLKFSKLKRKKEEKRKEKVMV